MMIAFEDGPDVASFANAQGPYFHDGDHYQYNYGETELQYWESFGHSDYDYATTELCISRMRPDQLSGVLEIYPRLWHWGTADYLSFYHDFRVRIPFTFMFGDHSAELTDEPTDSFVEPEGADRVSYGYFGLTYDEAWPWDDITDPTIRDAVYERYTPWNTP
jgi:hypothetical protein